MQDEDGTCVVCQDRVESVAPFSCRHKTCEPCARELAKRLLSCPVCRAQNQTEVEWSVDLSTVFVTTNVDTAVQSPQYAFRIPSNAQRTLRRLRRSGLAEVKNAALSTPDGASFEGSGMESAIEFENKIMDLAALCLVQQQSGL